MSKHNSEPNSEAPSPQRLPAAARRQQILEATFPRFADQGFAATGTRDLAAAAGVSEPVLYRHFKSKAGLFAAVVEHAGAQVRQALGQRLEGHATSVDRVQALATTLPALLQEQRRSLSILLRAALTDDEPILAAAGQEAEQIGQLLGQAFDGSDLHPDVAAETAGFALFQIGMGASVLRRLPVPTMDREEYSMRVVRMLLGGMSP